MVQLIWFNIGSDESLVPGSTKPSPEPMLRFQPRVLCGIHLWAVQKTGSVWWTNLSNQFEGQIIEITITRGLWS